MDAGTRPIITLDGPAASGKSSAAKAVAARLGIAYVSSGLLYRAATHMALAEGVPLGDERALLEMLARHDVRLWPDAQRDRLTVDGEEVAHLLHTDDIDARVSEVARLPGIRAWVTERLRELEGPFVIDGRDMGTAVFPDARWKFYLTASPEVRARRRVGERASDLGAVAEAIRLRDERDAKQSAPAPDAIHLDTGPLTLEAVADFVYFKVMSRWPEQLTAATA
ncbi:MAG TPA: (d)CMP kinase [Trueperaceae bacterium]